MPPTPPSKAHGHTPNLKKTFLVPSLQNPGYAPATLYSEYSYLTRCAQGVRVFFPSRESNLIKRNGMNKFRCFTEKLYSVNVRVFKIVAHSNVDN